MARPSVLTPRGKTLPQAGSACRGCAIGRAPMGRTAPWDTQRSVPLRQRPQVEEVHLQGVPRPVNRRCGLCEHRRAAPSGASKCFDATRQNLAAGRLCLPRMCNRKGSHGADRPMGYATICAPAAAASSGRSALARSTTTSKSPLRPVRAPASRAQWRVQAF